MCRRRRGRGRRPNAIAARARHGRLLAARARHASRRLRALRGGATRRRRRRRAAAVAAARRPQAAPRRRGGEAACGCSAHRRPPRPRWCSAAAAHPSRSNRDCNLRSGRAAAAERACGRRRAARMVAARWTPCPRRTVALPRARVDPRLRPQASFDCASPSARGRSQLGPDSVADLELLPGAGVGLGYRRLFDSLVNGRDSRRRARASSIRASRREPSLQIQPRPARRLKLVALLGTGLARLVFRDASRLRCLSSHLVDSGYKCRSCLLATRARPWRLF